LKRKEAQIEKQTNTEHGEVKLQLKRACLCTQGSRSILTDETLYGLKMLNTVWKL